MHSAEYTELEVFYLSSLKQNHSRVQSKCVLESPTMGEGARSIQRQVYVLVVDFLQVN